MGTWIGKVSKDQAMFISAPSKFDAVDFLERVNPKATVKDLEPMTRGFYATFKIHSDGTYVLSGVSINVNDEIKAIVQKAREERCRTRS